MPRSTKKIWTTHRNSKICYVHIAKAGSSFFGNFLRATFDTFEPYKRYLVDEILADSRLLVSSIRNPLGFYISWWNYNIRRKRKQYRCLLYGSFKESMKRVMAAETGGSDMEFALGREIGAGPFTMRVLGTFTDMLVAKNREVSFAGNSIDSLTRDDFKIKNIVKMENLQSELDQLLSKDCKAYSEHEREILFSLSKANVGTYGYMEDHYTPKIADWVRHKDRLIFKLFGYT